MWKYKYLCTKFTTVANLHRIILIFYNTCQNKAYSQNRFHKNTIQGIPNCTIIIDFNPIPVPIF